MSLYEFRFTKLFIAVALYLYNVRNIHRVTIWAKRSKSSIAIFYLVQNTSRPYRCHGSPAPTMETVEKKS